MTFDSSNIDQIRQAASIEEVIGQKINLTRKGKDFLALCPFHNDTKPSMHVSPQKQMFKCFACGAGGDVFKFLMEYEHLSFPESVKELANQYGIQLNESDQKQFHKRDEFLYIKDINAVAARVFHQYLFKHRGGDAARKYLKFRGIGKKTCEKFMIGYSSKEYRFLWEFIRKQFKPDQWSRTGLFFQKEGKTPIDFFRNRVMFPIFSERNEIIAFGGRLIEAGEPKYINTGDTPVFKKSQHLYGLNWCYHQMGREKTAYIVEGYLDVIACQQQDLPAVAPLGTALTTEQVRKLKRYAEKLILLFDGDNAGQRAALKSCVLLLENEINGEVVILPDGIDPFDYFKKNTKEDFIMLCEQQGKAVEDFYIEAYLPGGEITPTQKSQIAEKWLPLIQSIKNPVVKEDMGKRMAQALSISTDVLGRLWEEKKRPQRYRPDKKEAKAEKKNKLERSFVLFLSGNPSFIKKGATVILPEDLKDSGAVYIYEKLLLIRNEENIKFAQILDLFNKEEVKTYLMDNVFRMSNDEHQLEKQFQDYVCQLKIRQIEEKISYTSTLIQESELAGSSLEEAQERLILLTQERQNLREELSR